MPSEKKLYDSRAAVLEKLGRKVEALKDARTYINLAPNSWQVTCGPRCETSSM